jgi:hypothetical protein
VLNEEPHDRAHSCLHMVEQCRGLTARLLTFDADVAQVVCVCDDSVTFACHTLVSAAGEMMTCNSTFLADSSVADYSPTSLGHYIVHPHTRSQSRATDAQLTRMRCSWHMLEQDRDASLLPALDLFARLDNE